MRRATLSSAVLALALVVTTVGVPAETSAVPGGPSQGGARVRFIHASPDAPALDVLFDDAELLTSVGFGSISQYTGITGGTYTVALRPTGTSTPILTTTVSMTGGDYTLAAAGQLAGDEELQLMVLTDDNSHPPQGMARARFVHLVPDAPYPVTITLEGEPLFQDVVYGDVTPYATVPAGSHELQVLVLGAEAASATVVVGPNSVYSFFAIGLASGTPELDLLQVLDASYYHPGYSLVVTPDGAGDVDVNPDWATYPFGTEVILTATPDPDWTFVGWSGSVQSTDNPLELTVYGDVDLTATFAERRYQLHVRTVGHGSVEAEPHKPTYARGDQVTLTATGDPGWTFAGWSGDVTSTDNPLIVVIEDDTAVTANFTQDAYTLDVHVVGDGHVDRDPDQDTYVYGDLVRLTPLAHPGWTFVSWSGDVESTDSPLDLVVDGDMVVIATFDEGEYALHVPVIGEGHVGVDPDQETYRYGDVVTLTAKAHPGWTFVGWTGDVESADNPLVLMIEDDTTITAVFSQNAYTLQVNTVGEGHVDVEPDQESYVYGQVVTLTATPQSGSTFVGWTGDVETAENPLIVVIEDDTLITATFTQDAYILHLDIVGEGRLDIDPHQEAYAYGEVVTLTAIADPGWSFVGWSGDVDSMDNPLLLMVQGDTEITATFAEGEYALVVSVVGEGQVDIDPDQDTYSYAASVTLTAAADTGWTFADWSGDVYSTENPLQLTMDADRMLTATFELRTYLITPTVGVGGAIIPSTPQTVYHGDDITFIVTAHTGYHIADVVVDGISQGPVTSYTFSNVTADHTISASFAPNVAPRFVSVDHSTFVVRGTEVFTVEVVGAPTPIIQLSGLLPGGVMFTDNGDGTATLSGTPAVGAAGVYPLIFTASNGIVPDASQAFTLTVKTRIYLPLVLTHD